ncbi:hypothetical protein FPOAC2_12954 [Fusarium poae]|uniref:Uncharacterized protein n=1 Tax=Fusarium poae TaxID=36050 RepID=A0A1B8AHE2_FUSPO|nr:hypothetical protein FPOAC1_012595 [Fusarium poae]KAG8667756.1 hypothetical protein FPOAC1_012595 [Fusarium poae]OBS19977.1 hypothetical protein FPOA_11700 [Fusarium poae]
MSEFINQMIKDVWGPPRGTKLEPGGRKNPNNHQHYRKWGFTIYRTYYSKESDEHWQSLLYSLRHQTKLAFNAYEDDEEIDEDDRRKLQELFHLDSRDDPSVLDGLDVRGLRAFCNAELFKETKVIERGTIKLRVRTRPSEGQGMADYVFDFVLLADEAVLKDIERGEFIVKAVSLLWDNDLGWGWMRIPTGYLLDLWIFLMLHDDRTEYCLYIRGPEKDLEDHIWFAATGLDHTGGCSEIRHWRHYSTQKEDAHGQYPPDEFDALIEEAEMLSSSTQ